MWPIGRCSGFDELRDDRELTLAPDSTLYGEAKQGQIGLHHEKLEGVPHGIGLSATPSGRTDGRGLDEIHDPGWERPGKVIQGIESHGGTRRDAMCKQVVL